MSNEWLCNRFGFICMQKIVLFHVYLPLSFLKYQASKFFIITPTRRQVAHDERRPLRHNCLTYMYKYHPLYPIISSFCLELGGVKVAHKVVVELEHLNVSINLRMLVNGVDVVLSMVSIRCEAPNVVRKTCHQISVKFNNN